MRPLFARYDNAVAVLPPGFRPQFRELQPCKANANSECRVDVDPNGNIEIPVGNTGWTSLDGITFVAYQ